MNRFSIIRGGIPEGKPIVFRSRAIERATSKKLAGTSGGRTLQHGEEQDIFEIKIDEPLDTDMISDFSHFKNLSNLKLLGGFATREALKTLTTYFESYVKNGMVQNNVALSIQVNKWQSEDWDELSKLAKMSELNVCVSNWQAPKSLLQWGRRLRMSFEKDSVPTAVSFENFEVLLTNHYWNIDFSEILGACAVILPQAVQRLRLKVNSTQFDLERALPNSLQSLWVDTPPLESFQHKLPHLENLFMCGDGGLLNLFNMLAPQTKIFGTFGPLNLPSLINSLSSMKCLDQIYIHAKEGEVTKSEIETLAKNSISNKFEGVLTFESWGYHYFDRQKWIKENNRDFPPPYLLYKFLGY